MCPARPYADILCRTQNDRQAGTKAVGSAGPTTPAKLHLADKPMPLPGPSGMCFLLRTHNVTGATARIAPSMQSRCVGLRQMLHRVYETSAPRNCLLDERSQCRAGNVLFIGMNSLPIQGSALVFYLARRDVQPYPPAKHLLLQGTQAHWRSCNCPRPHPLDTLL